MEVPGEDFWINKDRPALVLAPMEGITDAPMRELMGQLGGPTHAVSEFLRISQGVLPRRVYLEHVPELAMGSRTSTGMPVGLQFLGGDPGLLADAAARAVEYGARSIDLNFGCPAPTVNRHDGGATLLKFPERIRAIVQAVRAAVPKSIPVSAKLRLGWDDMGAIDRNAAEAIEGGASWIAIHGRTRMQGYQPPAYWGPIARVREQSPVPVIANGEIWSLDDLAQCHEQTGARQFMIGRGALADPFLMRRARVWLEDRFGPAFDPNRVSAVPVEQWRALGDWTGESHHWKALLERFVVIARAHVDHPEYGIKRCKNWMSTASKRGHFRWFDEVKRTQNEDELMRALERIAERE